MGGPGIRRKRRLKQGVLAHLLYAVLQSHKGFLYSACTEVKSVWTASNFPVANRLCYHRPVFVPFYTNAGVGLPDASAAISAKTLGPTIPSLSGWIAPIVSVVLSRFAIGNCLGSSRSTLYFHATFIRSRLPSHWNGRSIALGARRICWKTTRLS